MEQRICRGCLLREMVHSDETRQAELERIEKFRASIKPADCVTADEYERRLSICRHCELLTAGTCNACGCYVELRAIGRASGCPRKKWAGAIKG